MVWTAADIEIVFDDFGTDDPVVTAEVTTPAGRLQVMATVTRIGRTLEFDGLHIHGENLALGVVGGGRLLQVLRALLEKLDVDEIIVRGAVRTTGARPGHQPRIIRVARKIQPSP